MITIRNSNEKDNNVRTPRLRRGLWFRRGSWALAPLLAALVGAGPWLASPAAAASAPPIVSDCAHYSSALVAYSCRFDTVAYKAGHVGAYQRVSTIFDNCSGLSDATKSLTGSARVETYVATETGSVSTVEFALAIPGVAEAGGLSTRLHYKISGNGQASVATTTIEGVVPRLSRGWIKYAPIELDASGWVHGVYKDPTMGTQRAWTHVYYPQLLDDGTADGWMWLHTEPCSGGGLETVPPANDRLIRSPQTPTS